MGQKLAKIVFSINLSTSVKYVYDGDNVDDLQLWIFYAKLHGTISTGFVTSFTIV